MGYYCTFKVKLTMWVVVPLVTVTVTTEVPIGVPGFRGAPPPPPPQPIVAVSEANNTKPRSVCHRRFLPGIPIRNTKPNAAPPVAVHQRRLALLFPGLTAEGGVVEIVSVVVPLPAIEAGLKLQLAPNGSPEHAAGLKATVPLNPFCAVTVRVVIPEAPGERTVTVWGLTSSVKSGGGAVIVKLTAVDMLELKLASPKY